MPAKTDDMPIVPGESAVAQSAFKVSLGGLFGLVTGLASQMIIASFFGAGAEMDAFLTALVVPVYFQAVLLSGLPFVFIPAFVEAETVRDDNQAWALAGTFFCLTAVILASVAVGGSLFAHRIIAISAPGLSPEKSHLAAQMLSVLMFVVPFTGLGTLTRGIQNARNRFFWPAVAPAVGSVGNVAVLLCLHRSVGPAALAWGYLVAGILSASLTIVPVLRHGWKSLIPLNDSRVHDMAKLIAPFILFGILTRSTSVFERYFASSLPDGDLSYLGYAGRVARILIAVLGSAIATAAFPTMARAHAQRGESGLVEETEHGFRLTVAVAFPAWALFGALSVPLVAVLFERGAFQHVATLATSRIVPIVVLGALVFRMIGNLTTRVYYVTKDTHTVPMVVAVTTVVYVLLAKALVDARGYVGLALAQPLHSGLAILILILLLVKRLRLLHAVSLLKITIVYGSASLVVFLAARLVCGVLVSLPSIVQLTAASLVAAAVYMAIIFRIERDVARSLLEMMGFGQLSGYARIAFRRAAESLAHMRG
jgi:putative peptidoglycan lipid II flippase